MKNDYSTLWLHIDIQQTTIQHSDLKQPLN